jgi:hypothetical protein
MDDFIKERLTPKILRGSGSTFASTAASTSDMQPTRVPEPSSSSSLDSYPKPQLLPSAMQQDTGFSPTKRPVLERRMPSESSEDDVTARYPTLATRRSIARLSQANDSAGTSVPAPLKTAQPAQPTIGSFGGYNGDHEPSEGALTSSEDLLNRNEGQWLPPQQSGVQKPARKWNFFQRAQAYPRPKGKARAISPSWQSEDRDYMPRGYRNVGHYAMLDPVEPVDLYEIQQIVQEGDTSPEESTSEQQPVIKVVPYESRHSSLLPSPPKPEFGKDSDFRAKPTPPRIMVRQDSSESPELLRAQAAMPQSLPQVVDIPRSPNTLSANNVVVSEQRTSDVPTGVSTPELQTAPFGSSENSENSSPRQPRLSPIGRIPPVVSKRDREYKLPETSFSRPFARTQPPTNVKPPGTLYNQIRSSRELTSPVDFGSQPVSSTSTRSDSATGMPKGSISTNPPSVSTNRTSMEVHGSNGSELLTFAPRKGSEVSYSSSSGNGSWYAPMTAIPMPPQEDDPWAEYDELMDDMLPQRTHSSAGSSLGAPFQYSGMLHSGYNSSIPTPLNIHQPPSADLPAPPRSNPVPAVLSVPQQIARFMQPSMSPLTEHTTLSGIYDHYGNQSTSTLVSPKRTSVPQPVKSATAQSYRTSMPDACTSMASSRHSRTSSLPEANKRNSQSSLTPSARFNRDTQLLDIAENEITDEDAAKANLRFGALMTSKWLSFGRVLFSPAHHEMRFSDEPRVLVIDGLNSDWSYYVAMSYAHAMVYNLGPATAQRSAPWPGNLPPNHREIPHSGIASAFPFPKGFFTAVVFRFPVASTDQAYHACLCECKRVLRPGGYLEVATIDLDLMNMGSRARSVVRGLKTRMQSRDSAVSLRNLSDFMVRLIGRRGFEEIQRCIVGVPAAGRIPRSQDISSNSSGHSGHHPVRPTPRRQATEEFTFTDLLEDARSSRVVPAAGNDEGITKMVAKVGRWWFSNCYESSLLQTDKSIWADHGLLRECEKQGTSFRLLICYAQKPNQTRRRTVSV